MTTRAQPLEDHELRAMVEQLPVIVAYWDRDQRCRFVNRAHQVWYGEKVTAVGTQMRDVLGPMYELNRAHIEAALAGTRQEFERLIPSPEGGAARPSRITYVPDIADGVVRGFFVLVTDLRGAVSDLGPALAAIEQTLSQSLALLDRGEAWQRVRESLLGARADAQHLRASHDTVVGVSGRQPFFLAELIASMDDSLIAVDLELRVQVWSPGAERMFGVRAAQMVGTPIFALTRPHWSSADAIAWRDRVLAAGTTRELGQRQRHGAPPLMVESNYAVLRDANGDALGIVGIGRDVTQREHQRQALVASEARYRAVLAAMSDGLVVRAATGELVDFNAAALRLLGLTEAQLAGREPVPEGWKALDASGQPVGRVGEEALRTHAPVTGRIGSIVHPDGHRTWLCVNAVPLGDASAGPPTGVVLTFADVTALFEAQRLEFDRARLLGLQQRSNEAELVLRNGVVVQANDRAAQMYGLAPEALVGLHVRALRADSTLGQLDAQLSEASAKGLRFQTEHRRHDGTVFPVEVSARPFEVQGEQYLHSLVRDLTDARRADQEHRLLASLMRELTDAVLVTDEALRVVEYTPASERLFGWARAEVLGRDLLAEVLETPPEATFRQALAERHSTRVSCRVARKAGDWLDLDAAYSPLHSEAGAFTGWLVVCRDVTGERAKQRAAQAREAQLAFVIDGSNDGFFDADLTTGLTQFSARWLRMFGYQPEEIDGTPQTCARLVHDDDRPHALAELERHLRGESAMFEFEERVRHRDGSWRHALVRGKCVERDPTGVPTRLAGVYTDITARKQAEAQLREAQQRVKTLSGMLPICMYCKKIRDDRGYWEKLEQYVVDHTDVLFSHGMCPACQREHFPDVDD